VTRRSSAATTVLLLLGLIAFGALPARAQSSTPVRDPQPPVIVTAATPMPDDDARLDPLEPDFVLVNLPTTLRLPVRAGNFHLTHRFNENLAHDEFSTQAGNLFGLDTGANIGLEFRFGVMRHLEAIVQRTSISQDVQFSAKYDGWHQNATTPVSVSGIVSIEGDHNFGASTSSGGTTHYSPALGVVVSRKIGTRLAAYADPFWVHNTAGVGLPTRDTGVLGLGARVRVASTVYVIGDVSPRIGGLVIRDPLYGFGIEKRVGAHVFALTFTNNPATTFRQMSQGGNPDTLNLGFNLTRKFF